MKQVHQLHPETDEKIICAENEKIGGFVVQIFGGVARGCFGVGHRLRERKQGPALVGQFDRARRARENPDPQLLLDAANAFRHHRLGEPHPLGRVRERAALRHAQHAKNMIQFEHMTSLTK